MTCNQIDAFLDQQWHGPGTSIPRPIALHLEQCATCRTLLASLDGSGPGAQASPRVQSQIENAVLGSLQPVKPLAPAREFTVDLLAVFAFILVVGMAIAGVRAPWRMGRWQCATLTSVLVGGAVLLAVSLSRQISPGARHRVSPRALIVAVATAFLGGALLLLPWRMTSQFWLWGGLCFSFGAVLAAAATVPFWRMARRGAILSPALTGATIGMLAGLLSATVVHLGCANITAPHVALWHAAIPVFTALAGYRLGSFFHHYHPSGH
jgi:hypothetical protein